MSRKVKAIPEGYEMPTPYLVVKGAAAAIDFYKNAFNAKETGRMPGPKGTIMHADLTIGAGHVMLSDENLEMGSPGLKADGPSPIRLVLYVDDADKVVKKAAAAGAKITRPVQTEFWGDRSGQIRDPFGCIWLVMTHVEDVPREEMAERASKAGVPA